MMTLRMPTIPLQIAATKNYCLFSRCLVESYTYIVNRGFTFLILLYTTTDYPNSYVDINVILPAIRLNAALSCRLYVL